MRSFSVLPKILLGLSVFCVGCGLQLPTAAHHNFWDPARPPQSPPDFHLILVWKEVQQQGAPRSYPLSKPDKLAEKLAQDIAANGMGRMRSYQILEDLSDLEPWLDYWRPEIPVLAVRAAFELYYSTSQWKAAITARGRFQALLYDTGADFQEVKGDIVKNLSAGDSKDRYSMRSWFADQEETLYKIFSKNLSGKFRAFLPKASVVYYHPGKSEKMKQAQLAAQAGDWKTAADLWQEESRLDPGNEKILSNLSVASEMMGDWKKALEYHQNGFGKKAVAKAAENPEEYAGLKSLGLVREMASFNNLRSLLTATADVERGMMLKGMAALQSPLAAKEPFGRSGTIAVLPLENMTNDLDAGVRVRKALFDSAGRVQAGLAPLDEIDEKLRRGGFTDAGQFRSTTSAKLGKITGADYLVTGNVEEFRMLPGNEVKAHIKLIYAPTGKIVFAKSLHVREEDRQDKAGTMVKAIDKALGTIIRKARDTELKPESEILAARFVRPWPHFRD